MSILLAVHNGAAFLRAKLDSILSLDDAEIKELQPTHFKLDHALSETKSDVHQLSTVENKVVIEEDPEINIELKEKKIDLASVQIRKPLKDRAGSD